MIGVININNFIERLVKIRFYDLTGNTRKMFSHVVLTYDTVKRTVFRETSVLITPQRRTNRQCKDKMEEESFIYVFSH